MSAQLEKLSDELKATVEEFFAKTEAVLRPFATQLEISTVPKTIYHYTNDVGLLGILSSGSIWLTDIFHLNDPAELLHGIRHATDVLKAKADDELPERAAFAGDFEAIQRGGLQASAHYFVASFSETKDDLGQWRAYADDGRGYALGFDGSALEAAFTRSSDGPIAGNMTFPVTYDDKILADLQEKIAAEALPYISLPRTRAFKREDITPYMRLLSVSYAVAALRTSTFFKHTAYAHEREYRYMQIQRGDQPAKGVKFRVRPYELVKYVEFDWREIAPTALKEIVIGPAADQDRAERFANDCMRAHHYEFGAAINILRSEIPYRSA